jgi:uncharacterized protein
MSQQTVRQPRLLTAGPPPTLLGHRCRSCERVFFPPDPFACERCGAETEQLESVDLRASGTIRAAARVHRHHHPTPETPFTVATIELDDGPALKSVVLDASDDDVGKRVRGVLVPSAIEPETFDLRFELEPT